MAFGRGDIRKILTEAGIADENLETAVQKIVTLHLGVVDPLKNTNDDLTSRVKAAEQLKTQLENANKELAELKDADYKSKYEAEKANGDKIKQEFETFKTEQSRKEIRAAKETAFIDVLKDAGVPERHYSKIIKYSDIDALELDENKKIKNANDVLKGVKDEWADHIEKVTETGAKTANPPTNDGSQGTMTKEEIMSIKNTTERQAAIAQNHELFGI